MRSGLPAVRVQACGPFELGQGLAFPRKVQDGSDRHAPLSDHLVVLLEGIWGVYGSRDAPQTTSCLGCEATARCWNVRKQHEGIGEVKTDCFQASAEV